jgi:hypothetical protein
MRVLFDKLGKAVRTDRVDVFMGKKQGSSIFA